MAQTLLLDTINWDLVVDLSGNIAVASEPYSLAQDVASACRLFVSELWFDTTQGIPYFPDILGALPPLSLLKAIYKQAALLVPDVASAELFVNGIDETRALSGQIQITSTSGQTTVALLALPQPTSSTEPVGVANLL